AGFTCPNRDGTLGKGGCTYCNNDSFNPSFCDQEKSITQQISNGISFFKTKYPDMKYLAYFQSYSNTYGQLEHLKNLYQEALAYTGMMGLVIATRPDCIYPELLEYLARLSEHTYVMLEYGVESHLNQTLEKINRGHTFEVSVKAFEYTANHGIRTCAHLILGLPGETTNDMMEQARIISQLPVDNLKLHQLQIHRGTVMAAQYRTNPESFHLFNPDEYTELVTDYLERLNPAIVVERFISQSPSDLLIAPKWGLKNFEFVARVEKRLKERNTWQGRLFGFDNPQPHTHDS
ncbi:MAG TPA: TIGR01212 family radical SAM protein, partial [Prolixibacteraceae bacterium]|nr:TIGR01212 family radical SAM protein [Prolixibacteraceae bacterium]